MSEGLQETCFVRLLKERALTSGDRPYFSCEGETITYGALWERAGQSALWLQRQGIASGDLVAGWAFNCVDYLILLHGCLRSGAVFAPLNPSLQKEEMLQTIARLRPKIFVVSEEMREKHGDALKEAELSVFALADSVRSPQDHGKADHPPEYNWKMSEWSWVVFSGATTGLPKAIKLPHGYGIGSARRVVEAIQVTSEDKWLSNLQMCHAWLDFMVLGSSLLVGAQCAATRWFSASRWLDQVHDFEATIVDPFLPMASALVAQPPSSRDRTHKVRVSPATWGTAAEADLRAAFEQRFGIHTVNCFGITEAGGLAAVETLGLPRRRGSVGKPTSDYQIVIADEDGNPVRPGEKGEVLYRPTRPSIMSLGYLGDEERTLTTWRDLWVHSGDLGYYDDDGYLYFVGRMPYWLRRKGENVSARDVETAIRKLEGVADAAVLPVASKLGDDDIKALVVLASGAQLRPADIHAALREKLSFFKVPRFIEIVESFPRTIKAEPDRKLLAATGLTGLEWDSEKPA